MNQIFILVSLLCITFCSEAFSKSSSQVFTFLQPQSFLQLQPEWSLHDINELGFKFRTDRPHGLLLFYTFKYEDTSNPDASVLTLYELYVKLENGCMKVIYVFPNAPDVAFFIGKGLSQDKWHYVRIKINPESGAIQLYASVDTSEKTQTVSYPSLPFNSVNNITYGMYFGGLDAKNKAIDQKYSFVPFIGCLGDIQFIHSDKSLLSTKVLMENQLLHNCVDQCAKNNPCAFSGKCVNHYTFTSCDCFHTRHEGKLCVSSNPVTATFRGYSYVTYKVYDYRDRMHSEATRIHFSFRTYFNNSILMYASGEHLGQNYVAMSLYSGQLYFEINFGDSPLNLTLGHFLNDEAWHTVTMTHFIKNISLQLDSWHAHLQVSGPHHHLHLDSEVYIGAAPKNSKGLMSKEKFTGCLHSFYFNDKSILHALHDGDNTAQYHGMFAVEYGCEFTKMIPMTFSLPESKLELKLPITSKLQFSFEFKTTQSSCVLASGGIKTKTDVDIWELLLHKSIVTFVINQSFKSDNPLWTLENHLSEKQLADNEWHQVGIIFDNREAKLEVDNHYVTKTTFKDSLEFLNQMNLTTSAKDPERGFTGCVQNISVFGSWIDPRTVVDTKQVSGKVSLDSCRLVDLCNNSYACEHDGHCHVKDGDTFCDCKKTGYTGRTCHFSLYKQTCEELYQIGYHKKGVYKIDMDRSGPLPPVHVYCDMGGKSASSIIIRIENNMPPEMVVRKRGMKSFFIDVTYREFTPAMLQFLIKHSKFCYQHIKYECFKAPLGLRAYTWMKSSGSQDYITSIGSQSKGCECAATQSCANSSILCNCDMADWKWRIDEGNFTNPYQLGIIRIYIRQPDELEPSAEGRLTLGPLECVAIDTQEYVITFKNWNSFIQLPGWYRGDITFSFRTVNSQVVLLYQTSIHSTHDYIRVLLVNDYVVSFEFTVNHQQRAINVTSKRKLNSGEWQQVWLEHHMHHMRFTVNLDFAITDYGEFQGVGPFTGPLYIGGVPESVAGESSIKEGFVGCFRGLVINDDVMDLYRYISRWGSAITQGCEPSCVSCQKGAACLECKESHFCKYANTHAHIIQNCDKNMNTNGMTVVVPKSYYHHITYGKKTNPVLERNILLSFRTFEKEGILLYAFDHYNNFVQLHFANSSVYFTFNSNRTIYQLHVEVTDLSIGMPIQVKVERQMQLTTLYVNDNNSTENIPMKFVDSYFQQPWTKGGNLELIFPPRGTNQTIDHSEIFIGHVGNGTNTNFPEHGFVGCIQGFVIGDKMFDLETTSAQNINVEGNIGGIRAGCAMVCDSQPCQNQGLCIEHWETNTTSCDCSHTSYTGEICQKDIAGSFNGDTTVKFSFDDKTITPEMQSDVVVRLAFSTELQVSSLQVLFFMQFNEEKHILIGILNDSTLFVEEKKNVSLIQRREVVTSGSWSDNNRHWFYISWKFESVTLIVDGKSFNSSVDISETVAESYNNMSNILYISGFPKNVERDLKRFKGCISNVVIELGKLKLMPLETAFGYKNKAIDKIKVEGSIKETKCASFALLPDMLPTVPESNWVPELLVTELNKTANIRSPLEDIKKITAHVAAVMGAFLIFVILIVFRYIYNLNRRQPGLDKKFHHNEKENAINLKYIRSVSS